MADDSGSRGMRAQHVNGVTTVESRLVTTRIPGAFFSWLDRNWCSSQARDPALPPGLDFALGWLGYLGYELKRECGGSVIAPGQSRAAVVAAAYPPGSMTGAPKISSMDILDELESGPRGPYSGVVGYFSGDGAADLSVTIRSAVFQNSPGGGQRLSVGIGGAITADSDPDDELAEIQTKAKAILGVLGAAFPE
jgi:hypothetical protein